jgi:hypothetical protein
LRGRIRWLVVIPLGIVIGVAATLAVWSFTGDDDGSGAGRRTPQSLGRKLEAGARVDASALWLFGFDTVRVDPVALDHARGLGSPVFGQSAARGDAVFFYDPIAGKVGRLDAATSRLSVAQPVAPWTPPGAQGDIAATTDAAWLVTGTDRVTSMDVTSLDVREQFTLDVPGATQTWISAAGSRAVAATANAAGVTLTALGEAAATPKRVTIDPGIGPAQGVARGDGVTWIVQTTGATAVEDSGDTVAIALPSDAGLIRAAVTNGRELWLLAEDGAAAYRLRPEDTDPVTRVAVLAARPPAFRAPVALANSDGAIYVLVPTRTEPDRHDAVVVRIDPANAEVTKSLTLPSNLFVGGIAATQ